MAEEIIQGDIKWTEKFSSSKCYCVRQLSLILICPLAHILIMRGIHSNSQNTMMPQQIEHKDSEWRVWLCSEKWIMRIKLFFWSLYWWVFFLIYTEMPFRQDLLSPSLNRLVFSANCNTPSGNNERNSIGEFIHVPPDIIELKILAINILIS